MDLFTIKLPVPLVKLMMTLFMCSFIACSLPVRPTHAPSQPPRLDIKTFESAKLQGKYKAFASPKMFLWPVYKQDPETGEEVLMSFEEQVESRQEIMYTADQIQFYESEILRAETEIKERYADIMWELESEFRGLKCYSYCDPEDFIFCDPFDDSVLFVDDWMETEDPDKQKIILTCQENQSEREDLTDEKNAELREKLNPLRAKAAEYGGRFFTAIGDEFFTEFSEFTMLIDEDDIQIQMVFGPHTFATDLNRPDLFQVTDVHLDKVDGFLSFKAPRLNSSGEKVGTIFYDLELSFNDEGQLSVNGDIRLNELGQRERIGRFSSSGEMR